VTAVGRGTGPVTELDRVLPEWHFRELHCTQVDAQPERVFAAVRAVTLAEMPLARLLVRARGLRVAVDRPVLEQAMRSFSWVAHEAGRELVLASIGRPWRYRGGEGPNADFVPFDEPGFAKMALSFRLDGRTLSTETRVLLTDERSRRAFRRYWLLIRPFSGLLRRVWLRAIERRAEGRAR
jgi:hypothetical protein